MVRLLQFVLTNQSLNKEQKLEQTLVEIFSYFIQLRSFGVSPASGDFCTKVENINQL